MISALIFMVIFVLVLIVLLQSLMLYICVLHLRALV